MARRRAEGSVGDEALRDGERRQPIGRNGYP
jgi:hypothetical protein